MKQQKLFFTKYIGNLLTFGIGSISVSTNEILVKVYFELFQLIYYYFSFL